MANRSNWDAKHKGGPVEMLLTADPFHAFMPYPPQEVEHAAEGPLAGLTLAVKDIFDVAGYRTGCGNPMKLAEAAPAPRHAPPVAALLAAGARFVGKAHTEELAWSLYGTNVHFGTPINPAAPDRVPGGSSSGSASAVAGGLCDIALGSDTGGSVRAPASFCGIYGLRPTHGAISLDDCMPLAPSLDTCGFFARDAATLGRIGQVLLPSGSRTLSRPLIATDVFSLLPEDTRAAFLPALARLAAAVGSTAPVEVYHQPVSALFSCFRTIQSYEANICHGDWIARRRPVLAPAIAARFAYAASVGEAEYQAALELRQQFATHMLDLLADDGLLILPTLHAPAPRLDSSEAELATYRDEAMRLLLIAGLAGLPQLALPAITLDGAPLGLSLIGPRGSDQALLELAARIGHLD